MDDLNWIEQQAQVSLERLLPRVESVFANTADWEVFLQRLAEHFPAVFRLLYALYGKQYDFFYHLEQTLIAAAQMNADRPADLKQMDQEREANPLWFQSEKMVGGVYYVDLFAGDLKGLRERLPYLEELGLTYLHLMPLFKCPQANSDGGYAVSDYRQVDPRLGTMEELAALAAELRQRGISLVLDFVFNHTSDEHEWAIRAAAGDPQYRDFYYIFDDRTMPDQYAPHLREIFPDQAPGSFTYKPEIGKWVWTTFHDFQWDLNYANPAVFTAMLREMLFLANQGVEVLRLDAVAFIWKQLGTPCENLPQVHWIIQAFNALVKVAAPTMMFKSEAIVHPRDVASYISWEECPISYNPTLMALLWETLATRQVRLLHLSMSRLFALPGDCSWVNYVRCHDDIGWTFADEDAAELGINGYGHRQFLNRFYTGVFPGSFAKGMPFNYNPVNQDMRISGTAASLAGLEQALALENDLYREHARRRLILIYSVVLSVGGIPLIYLGDEIAMLNGYEYQDNPAKQHDSRWVHRPQFDWDRAALRHDESTVPGAVFQALRRLIAIRSGTPALANGHTHFFYSGSPHVLAYVRSGQVLVLANFSEFEQVINHHFLAVYDASSEQLTDLVTGQALAVSEDIRLEPYQFMWLV